MRIMVNKLRSALSLLIDGYSDAMVVITVLLRQVSSLLAGQTMEGARTFVCPLQTDGSTAVAVETDDSLKTIPVQVRERERERERGRGREREICQSMVEGVMVKMYSRRCDLQNVSLITHFK